MPHQLQNVAKAERRFDAHHGFMITDGTGTGKTYSGVGVIKRFYLAAKRNILLVGPSDQVLLQWSNLLNIFGIKHSKLDGTKDGGSGVSITTLSNFSANKALQSRLFDLVLIDEAHKLLAEQKGTTNLAVRSLRANTLHPDGLRDRARAQLPELSEQVQKAQADFESMQDSLWSERGRAREELVRLNRKLDAEINKKVEQFKGEPRPKVLFLSATPFAYVPALDYAEGFLFEYGEESGRPLRYNEPSPKQRFYIQHFGYSMRVNKLTQPEGGVDSGVMERRFHEHLKRENALTSTVLEIAQDYDRRFVIVDNAVGNKIDEVLAFLDKSENRRYRPIEEIITARFKYHERARLLEALKAESAIKIIQDHLDLGRKVVVFHDFNEGGGFNPFERPGDIDIRSEFVLKKGATNEHETVRLAVLWDEFEAANPFIKQAEWSALPSPIVTIKRAFKNSAVFNGEIKKDARADAVKSFNSDEAGSINVIIAQSRAMSEGVSLHDLTGKHQRVILHLGMPTRPTDAIQQEGRIYRVGMKTNAIFRYLNTGTLWERYAFVSKISERIGTAENLGMGDKARTLQRSFIDAFMDSGHYQASQDDGIGGKEQDRQQRETSPFELAKSLYFGQQKTAGRRDQRAGKDYYATPEPIGLKMVEWADIKTGDHVLEPSAGHGAISRWFPEGANTTIVEPSAELLSRAQLNVTQPHTRSIHGTFEDLHISNKFDAIVMNPPFGVGGKTAIEHVAKAAKHLRVGGRMVALIPQGRGFDRLTEWLDSDAGDGMRTIGVISLPAVAFERAGTSVRTVVVVLDKVPSKNLADLSTTKRVDLSNRETIKELFDSVEDVTIPSRVEMTQQEEREVGVDAEVVEESASDTPQASYLRLQHNLEARFDENAGTYHLVGLSRRPSNDTWKIKERIREVGGGKWNRIEKRWEFPADPTVKLAEILGYKEEPNVRFALANAGSQEAGTTRKPRLAKSVVQSAIAPALESFKAGIERNGVHVEVVQTIHDLLNRKQITKLTQDDYRKLRNAKGFYLPKDRKIVLIANNIESGRDARNTLNHELAVHFGLDLLGREAKTEFLREVALSMKQEKNRADYEKVVEKYKDLTEAEIAEEFFAYVTESAEPGLRALADKLITRVIGLFRKIGWMRNYPMTLSEMRDFARSLAQGIREGKDRADLPKSIATAKTPVAGKQTVNVDGKDRPTVNSDGQPLHWSVEGVRNFWRWLGDSKAVDGNGRPVAVYRGTGDDFGSTKPFLPGVSGKAENEKTLQAVKDAIGRVLQTGSARMLYTAYVREEDSDVMFVVEHADGGEVRMSQGDGFQSAADDALEIPFTPITGNETLEVDGKSRPTMNSNGQPIHWSEEGVRNFWRWFGDSKVVDGEGRPLVMYHGTNRSESGIAAFDVYGSNYGLFGTGSYFTDNPSVAGGYATAKRSWEKGSPTIYPVYIKNDTPLDMNAKADQQEWEAGFPDVDFDVFEPTSKTNEGYLRAVEEYFENEGWVRDEASQAITENIVNMGYSGVTHIGGGRITQDGPKHRVHIVYEPEQVKSATGNFGTFDPENPDIRYSLINPLTNPKPVKEWFAEASDNMARRFQNRFKDIWNRKMHPVIQALTLQPGRIGEAIHDFNVENVHPLIQAIKDAGIGYDEVEQVLRALHTQEANAHLKDLHERLGTDLGGRDKDALSGETNDWARGVLSKYTKASLMAAGKTESEAIRIRNKLADISAMVARIADATLFKWEESGMITPEKSFIYQNMFQHYIPMHREGFDDSPVQGRGIHVPSKPVKSRTGSDLEVVDVLAHLIGQHEAAIILAEKATVGRALYNWFKANPDPNFVQFKPAPVSRNIADPDIIEKNQAWMQQDHVLRVMFDGHERFMVFNKHNKVALRMVMAIKGMTDNGIPHYLRWFAEMGRFFTGLLTKYSVDFMLTNLARDIETAFANVSGTQAEGRAVEMVKGIPAAFAAIRESQKGGADHPLSKDLYEWRRRGGKTGFTVYYDNASSRTKDLKWQLRMLQDDPTAKGLRAGKALIDAFGNMNDALEGATRLSAYVQARKAGMSEDEAAVFSKNITVNFNQRGEYGSIVNMLFWFFNANVQGTTRMMKAVLTSRGAKLATGITMLGFSVTLASLLLGGGDDKEKPEDDALLRLAPGDEAKNAFIRFWDGDVFKIPLAWGYNLFYLAGAKAAQQLYRQINGMPTHAVDAAGEMLLAAFEAFSPVGTSPTALQFFTPSIAKPFQQVAENRAWHGGPVRPRENVFDRSNKPAYTQHFAKTSDVFVGMSKGLHSLTKRDTGPAILDIYPDSLQHVFDSFAGGPGRLVRQLTTITQKSLEGDMVGITTQNIPILRRFWGLNVDGVEKNRFYDSVEAVATLEGRIKMAIKDRDDKERLRLLKDNAKLLPMIGQLKTVDSQTKLVSDRIKLLKTARDKTPKAFDMIRDLEKRQLTIMKNFSNSVERAMQ